MLGSEKNKWLSTAVTTIELVDDGTGRVDFERSCKLLATSGKLPSLAELGLNTLQKTYSRTTQIQPFVTTLPSKAVLSSFINIRTFSILGVDVLSFSALARVLGGLPQLVQLAFHRVRWIHEDIDYRPLALATSSFAHLRLIIADDTLAWPLMHLWASKLRVNRRRGSATSGGGNLDVELLSSLVKIFCDSSSTTRMVIKYDPESESIQTSSYEADTHWALRVKLLPVHLDASLPSITCYIISSIELRVAEPKFFEKPRHNIDWAKLDQLCTETLEELSIGIDPIHSDSEELQLSLPERFPMLVSQGRINVKLIYWERLSDGMVSLEPTLASYISVKRRVQSALEDIPALQKVPPWSTEPPK